MKSKIVILCILIFSCNREIRMQVQGASYCLSQKLHLDNEVPSLDEANKIMDDKELTKAFSPKSIRLAIAYNFYNDLKLYLRLNPKINKNNLDIEKIENKIYRKITAMSLDIDSTTSEFSCYVDRFTEILSMMKEKEDDIVLSNTLYAILFGAFAAFVDVATQEITWVNKTAIIAGGFGVTYFSYKAFTPNVTIEFKPKSTNLKDIWFNPEYTENYSKPMWFIMTKPVLKNEFAMRDLLVQRWIENHFLGDENERGKYIDLFFGKGGVSNISQITNRREMNNEVRSLIFLLKQDIKGFEIEFSKLRD